MSEITEEKQQTVEEKQDEKQQDVKQHDEKVEKEVNLMEIKVETETDALNLMAGFLQIAQRRGAYSLAEAGKIMEAINKFEKST